VYLFGVAGISNFLFMDDEKFGGLIERAVNSLPVEFKAKLENVSIVLREWPSLAQMAKHVGRGGLLLGLYEGIPQTRRGSYGIGGPLPDKVTIFKIPILMISKTENEVEKNVRDTVIHEIAHHFGMDDLEIKSAKERYHERR
jgi:predicted Zn-dependent protease with MMP-like domain